MSWSVLRLGDVAHALFEPRSIPTTGIGLGATVVLLGTLGEVDWHKIASILGAAIILAAQLLKLAADLNGLGRTTREHNALQDAQIVMLMEAKQEFEERLTKLEAGRG